MTTIQVPAGKKGNTFVQEYVKANGYPEVGSIDSDHLKKFYKNLDDEQLVAWVTQLEAEWSPNDNASINRMRMCMAVYGVHFPKAPSEKKSKSKYAQYTDEQLLDMALEHEVIFEPCDDPRILRMRAIMALRAHKVIE